MIESEDSGSFGGFTSYISGTVVYNEGNKTQATIRLNPVCLSNPSYFYFYLSNDGGLSWERCTLKIPYTFTNAGNHIKYKITSMTGETINLIQGNNRYEIQVSYI